MRDQRSILCRIAADTTAATAIEYGLFAAILGIGLIAGAKGFSVSANGLFTGISTELAKYLGA